MATKGHFVSRPRAVGRHEVNRERDRDREREREETKQTIKIHFGRQKCMINLALNVGAYLYTPVFPDLSSS
jgi:hypothetical protein